MSALVKTVEVKVGGKTRRMRLTLGDARRFKERTTTEARPGGISLLQGGLRDADMAEDEWLTLFVCCFEHEDPDLTESALGEVLDMYGFRKLVRVLVTDLLPSFLPDPAEDEESEDEGGEEDPPQPGLKVG